MKKIVILGSTGSIGRNAIDVIRQNPDKYKLVGLAANTNYGLLSHQASSFNVKNIAVGDYDLTGKLKKSVSRATKIYAGSEGVKEIAALKEADLVLMAISGTASLEPLIESINAKKDIALASKESLVSAGPLVMKLKEKKNVKLLPVDSEHSAIFQCIQGNGIKSLKKIYLTGTGGPLHKIKKSFFDRLPISRVIRHPKWKMGKKITVDSATLMNKGLEVIEAHYLFGLDPKKIQVLLHPEAIIHSMVEFVDGAILANLFSPDMRIPIFYAFNYPERYENKFPRVDFLKLQKLTFGRPALRKFPALSLAYESLRIGHSAPCVLNAANEEAVKIYLNGKIKFTKIIETVEKVLRLHRVTKEPSLKDIFRLDKWAKEEARRLC